MLGGCSYGYGYGYSQVSAQEVQQLIQRDRASELLTLSRQKHLNVMGVPLLIHLIQTQNWELATTLLYLGLEPNPQDSNGLSAVMWAIKDGPIPFTKHLLREAVIKNHGKTDFGFQGIVEGKKKMFYGSPLNLAVGYRNDLSLVKYMIEQLNFDPDEDEYNRDSIRIDWAPIFFAVFYDNLTMAKYLLEQGANCDYDADGRYPLTTASLYASHEMIELFLHCSRSNESLRDDAIYSAQSHLMRTNDTTTLFKLVSWNYHVNQYERLAVEAIEIENLNLAHRFIDSISIIDSNDYYNSISGHSIIQRSYYSGDTALFKKVLSKTSKFYLEQGQDPLQLLDCEQDQFCVRNLKYMLEAGADPFMPLSLLSKDTNGSVQGMQSVPVPRGIPETGFSLAFKKRQKPLIKYYIDHYRDKLLEYKEALLESIVFYPLNGDYELMQSIFVQINRTFEIDLDKRYRLIEKAERADNENDNNAYRSLLSKYISNLDEYLAHSKCFNQSSCITMEYER